MLKIDEFEQAKEGACLHIGVMQMRNNVYFRTRLFENVEPKPHFINPRCFGEDLVLWLLQRLQGTPFSLGDSIQEDYGWGFRVEHDYWVAAGVVDDSIGIENPQWLVSVDYDAGLNLGKRLFREADRTLQLRICGAIDLLLHKEQDVTDIRWCDEQGTDCGESPD